MENFHNYSNKCELSSVSQPIVTKQLKVAWETAQLQEIYRISHIFFVHEIDDMGRIFPLFQKGVLLPFPQ